MVRIRSCEDPAEPVRRMTECEAAEPFLSTEWHESQQHSVLAASRGRARVVNDILATPWQLFRKVNLVLVWKREVEDGFLIHCYATKYFAAG